MIFVSLIMVAATPYFGPEIKGARRWLALLGVNIQPSEFSNPPLSSLGYRLAVLANPKTP
jgi:cell division protein FtsW (lipid II flippase)